MEDPRPKQPKLRQIKCTCGKVIVAWSTCKGNPSLQGNLDALFALMRPHNRVGLRQLLHGTHRLYVVEMTPGDV